MHDALLRAIDLALDDQWEEAHRIVQEDETDPMAAWIHAVLHWIEGDLANSRYWYRRAGRLDRIDRDPAGGPPGDPAEELRAIRTALTSRPV